MNSENPAMKPIVRTLIIGGHFGWIFWPAFLIDIVFYAMLYLLFRQAVSWKRRTDAPGQKP